LSRRAGTRFVDRDALRELVGVVRELTEHLDSGGSVMVFPQATTWCTAPGGPFRRAAFQAALDAGAPVRPVGIDFSQNGRVSTAASYVGDATLEASVRRVAFSEGLVARVTACTPLRPDGHDRRSLAAAAYAAVCEAVGRPVPVEGPNAVPGETDGPTTGP
jgi:1-acyl-sn-glycerol-3-phosphate acyltransferase